MKTDDLPTRLTTEDILKYHQKFSGKDFDAWLEITWVREE